MPWPIGLVVKNGSKARAITSGGMPVPVSVTLMTRTARGIVAAPGARSSSPRCGLDRERAAVRHGVARVDREVEQRVLELVGVAERRPQPSARLDLEVDRVADRAAQQVLHAGDQRVDVGRLRIERLPAREGQQPVGQRGGPLADSCAASM